MHLAILWCSNVFREECLSGEVKSWEMLWAKQVCGLVSHYFCTQWPTGKFGCFSGTEDRSLSCNAPCSFSTGPLLTMSSRRVWREGCNYSCWNEGWDPLLWGVTGFITHRNLVWSVGAFVLVLISVCPPGEELLFPSTGHWGLTSEMVKWSHVSITNEVLP